MITFYKSDETDFNNNGLGVLDRDIQSPDIEEKMNDIFTLSFNYPIFATNGSRLSARMIVKADDPENEGQIFRILKLSKSNGMLTAFCYHIFYDLNGNEIPDTNIVGQNGQTAISQMLSKTAMKHGFTGYSDITNTANIRVVRMSPVKFLIDTQTDNNFINRLGGEIRRVNYRIYMNKVRGSDNGATIRWKKSLDSYNATWDYTTVVTRIRPVGYNGIMLPESYVDSPKINDYETIIIKEIQYSDIKAIDPDASSNDENAVPLEQAYDLMRQAAAKEFSENHLDDPTVTLTVNMVALRNTEEYAEVQQLETINPWDTVTVINERDNLSVKVRLNHYHYNPATHKFISMELGNSQSTFTDIGSKVDHANNTANEANDNANNALESANGKNSNYYGPSEPSKPVDGDLWYKQNGDKTELWQYDGKSVPPGWKLVVDDATGEEVKQSVDEALKGTQEAINNANDAVAKANQAVADAGFANNTADQAKTDAASALQKALDAYNHGDQIKTGLTADIDAVKGQVNLKANQIDVDKLGGRVANAEAQIKLQADQIALTVSKTELTGILGKYATQTWTQSQIKTTADQINLSVTQIKTEVENNDTENLIPNSSFKLGKTGWSGWETPYTHDPVVETYHSKQYTAVYFGQNKQPYVDLIHDGKIPMKPNTPYVFQIKTRSLIKNHPVTYIQEYDSAGKVINDHEFILNVNSPDYITNIQKFNTSATAEYGVLRIRAQPGDQFMASELMLTEGTIVPKNWYPSSVDNATTADFASLEITIKGIQTTVGNKADQSQVTQLANQITSVVKSSSNPNLIPNSGHPKDITYWNTNKSGSLGIAKHAFYEGNNTNLFYLQNDSATAETTAGTVRVPVTPGATYTLSGVFFAGSNVVGADVWFLSRAGSNTSVDYTGRQQLATNVKFNPSAAERRKYTFTVPGDVTEGYVRIDNNGSSSGSARVYFAELKLERGENYTAWVYDDALSQITQLANDINLRVQKGDVINQINISPEGILIAGQKIHITGQTSIDNAVIKDAMIANIKADKITAGTLNAAKINVINLNANSITSGTLNAIAINGSTITGAKINGANITSQNTGNAAAVNLYNGTINFKSGNGAEVGMIFPTYDASTGKANGLAIEQIPGSIFSINTKNTSSGLSRSVIQVPASSNQNNPQVNYYGHKNFYDDTKFNGILNIASGGHINSSGQDVSYNGNNKSALGIGSNTSWSNVAEATKGKLTVWGEFQVWNGAKNAIVATRDGFRAMYAYETAESYFGDIGESRTDDMGMCVVKISDLFADTIHMEDGYQVFVSSYSASLVWVEARNYGNFIVKSEKPNTKFAWEIKGIRRGFNNKRMELQEEQFNILDTENHEPIREYKLEEK